MTTLIALATVAAVTKAKESNKITRGTLSAKDVTLINLDTLNLPSNNVGLSTNKKTVHLNAPRVILDGETTIR